MAAPAPQSCRSCRFLELPANKAGKLYVTPGRAYKCTVEIPEPALPDSVKGSVGWRWPPPRSWVEATQGTTCPLWEARPPAG